MSTLPTPAGPARPPVKPSPRLRAYIIEDSPVIRDSLVAALEELVPLQVVGTAQAEAEALDALSPTSPQRAQCDVVIVDLFLRQGSGLGVLAALQGRPDAPVRVVLTNHSSPAMRARCLALGASRVFDKSAELDGLLHYCSALLERDGGARRAN
jgi:two-component system, OmpR family, response regulator